MKTLLLWLDTKETVRVSMENQDPKLSIKLDKDDLVLAQRTIEANSFGTYSLPFDWRKILGDSNFEQLQEWVVWNTYE